MNPRSILRALFGWLRAHPVLAALFAIPVLHILVWLAFGERLLFGQLPRMAYADFHDQYAPARRGLAVIEGIEQLPPNVVEGLGSVFAERGSKMLPFAVGRKLLEDCRSGSPRDPDGCGACGHFEYWIPSNNPLVARVSTSHTPCGGYCSTFEHVFVYALGVPILVSSGMSGQC
jgi:hypothetical protein